jgi:hypothetical protein
LSRRTRAKLKSDISDETMEAARSYLASFSRGAHTVERFDGAISIYFADPRDLRLIQDQFPDLVQEVTDPF